MEPFNGMVEMCLLEIIQKLKRTVIHECGHSLSLPHVFQEGSYAGKHTFYHGYTDNYMDYTWQRGPNNASGRKTSSGRNVHEGNMYSFFKWQWDTLRTDRSLIFSY